MVGAGDDAELPDFGLHHPDDLEQTIELAHVLTNYHVLPEAGGWLDQDAALTDDILTWLRLVEDADARLHPKDRDKARDPYDELMGHDDPHDMETLFG